MRRRLSWVMFLSLIGGVATLGASMIAFFVVDVFATRSAATAIAVVTGFITGGACVYGYWSGGRRQRTAGQA